MGCASARRVGRVGSSIRISAEHLEIAWNQWGGAGSQCVCEARRVGSARLFRFFGHASTPPHDFAYIDYAKPTTPSTVMPYGPFYEDEASPALLIRDPGESASNEPRRRLREPAGRFEETACLALRCLIRNT
jgi:hypothetical protein